MSALADKLRSPFTKAVLWLLTGAALATVFFGIHARHHQSSSRVLRTYTVTPALEGSLQQALRLALAGQDAAIVDTGVSGQLLISAPQSIQDQIPKLFASLGNAVTKAPTLLFDVWYVAATDGAANLDEPALAGIRSTLEQIVKVDGPKHFALRLRKALRVQAGSTAEAMPIFRGIVNPRLLKRADGVEVITTELALGEETSQGSILTTRLEMVPGETLVIGQTTRKAGASLETQYQILRASL